MNPFTTIIKERRSIRKFNREPISQDIIRDILDCARMAPTARNVQDWLFGVVTDKKILDQISQMAQYGKFIKNAAACFAVFYDGNAKYFLEDGCAATMNILLSCSAHGIASCWVAGHKKNYAQSVKELLNVPGSYTLISLVPAGYSEEKPSVKKKPLDDLIFFNTWNAVS